MSQRPGHRQDPQTTAAGPVGRTVHPTVDASTILLLRDGSGSPEVLLLERHIESDFAGGALVFPGGKVDPADRELAAARWRGADLPTWRESLGADDDAHALGLLVAAVRETFEEANVLLASRDGEPLTDSDLEQPEFVEARRRLASRGEAFDWRDWLAEQRLVLELGALAPWSRWVTPKGQHKRFDTRFFAARLPTGQSGRSDAVETTDLRWTTPRSALAAQRAGEMVVIFPTRRNLQALDTYSSADAAWRAAAREETDLRRIEPTLVRREGTILVRHPDEDTPEPI